MGVLRALLCHPHGDRRLSRGLPAGYLVGIANRVISAMLGGSSGLRSLPDILKLSNRRV